MGKTEDLQTNKFRKVLKSCSDSVSTRPQIKDDPFEEIEKLSVSTPPRPRYERPHYFNETEFSPGKSTYTKNDFCPCGMDSEATCLPGQREVHIPYLNFSSPTYLKLREAVEHAHHIILRA